MQRKIIPDIVKRKSIASVVGEDSITKAAKMMADANIAALIVLNQDDMITGILTERDLTQRVMAKGLDANTTLCQAIMTANPDTLEASSSAGDALELMQSRGYRHLPVAEDGKCVGMVSIRDLYAAAKETLEENIRETEAFVFGDRYGA